MEQITLLISLVVILIYASLAFVKPRIAIYLLIFFSIFDLGFFSRWIGAPRYLGRIPFFLAGLLTLIFIVNYFYGKLKLKKNDKEIIFILIFIIFLICFAIISCLYNGVNIALGLYELRYYYLIIIVTISIIYYLSYLNTIYNFISFCTLIGIIQIPFTIIQYILVQIGGVRLSKSALDMSSGTFVGYPSLVFMQCVAIAVVLEYQLYVKKPLFKINNYLLALLLVIPLLLSYSRSSMAFVLATVIIIYSRDMLKNINPTKLLKRSFTLLSVCLIFLFVFWRYFFEVHHFTEQLNVDYIIDYFMKDPKGLQEYQAGAHGIMGRGRAITEAINLVSNNYFTFLLGMGSGSCAEADFMGLKGRYFYEYGPMAGIGRTQMSKTIVELGFFGASIIGYFFIKLFLLEKVPDGIGNKKDNNLINNTRVNVLFIIFLCSFYGTILTTEISIVIIGFLIAVKYRYANEVLRT